MTANPTQPAPQLSIVIPVYNEEEGLQALFDRLYPAMDQLQAKLNLRYEIVFVNDGSKDRSAGMLAAQFDLRPDVTRVVLFQNNFNKKNLNIKFANPIYPYVTTSGNSLYY